MRSAKSQGQTRKEGGSAQRVIQRISALAKISEEPGRLTRTFCSHAMRKAHKLFGSWMRNAGMKVRVDAIGNLIGHYGAKETNRDKGKVLLIGSHLDTVRNAGKFDGPLGVLSGIACVENLKRQNIRFPFAIEVVGFADEEGVRYHTTYLGSRVLAGTFDDKDLKRVDAKGISMADAIRGFGGNPGWLAHAKLNSKQLLAYVEVHIEQGPVLEQKNLAVGVVTGIAGQTRAHYSFSGRAGHAGTTPMSLRKDALCAAAEFVLGVESYARSRSGLVATVGELNVESAASNVIPGSVTLSVDVRHANDAARAKACAKIHALARQIGLKRGVTVQKKPVQQTKAVACDPSLISLLNKSVHKHQPQTLLLPSGAGHDAAAMAAVAPVAMLFVRCKHGISHHPAESASTKDIQVAISVMNNFLQLCGEHFVGAA